MRPRHPYQVRDPEALKERMHSTQRVVPHSVRSLASVVGRSSTTIGDLLTGKQTRVSQDLAVSLAVALGARLEDLFVPTASVSSDSDMDQGAEEVRPNE